LAEKFTEEKILDFIKSSRPRSVSLNNIHRKFGVPASARKPLRRMLHRMVAEGTIRKGSDGKYSLPEQTKLIVGKVHGKAQGYAFVEPDDGITEDVFVREENQAGAMHRDKVEVQVTTWKRGGRMEGRVTRVLERANEVVVGYYETTGKVARVIPAERKIRHHIYIPRKQRLGARDGDVVMARITEYPAADKQPRGRVVEILGKPEQEDIELQIIIHKFGIPHEFPPEALSEAAECPAEVGEDQSAGREDLRDVPAFTIDGENARDFDDAVSLQRLGNGNLLLGVHIADVSHYVVPGSGLDREARYRGNSVYFPDRVIPMLPHQLSNDICSLNPEVDRLTMSVLMELTPKGEMRGHRIVQSVIKSRARLTYTIASRLISGNGGDDTENFKDLRGTLRDMADLAETLRRGRMKDGSMDFDLPEAEVVFDLEGGLLGVLRAERNVAHRLIEEFMLLANRTVAAHISAAGLPSIYRNHEKPDPEKLEEFADFARNMGYDTRGVVNSSSRALQRILQEAADKPEELIINNLLLRSMKQARYTTENTGHFALAFDCYTHFTSPIRRYPDLMVHRILKLMQRGERVKEGFSEELKDIAQHCSERERAAEEAEREMVKLMCAELMSDHIGEEFEGVIIGLISSGMFIELDRHFIEGFIHVSDLKDDYYSHDEGAHALVGERRGGVYGIGDRVLVKVTNVSIQQRHIDLSLVRKL
jgi:ribonuclease R